MLCFVHHEQYILTWSSVVSVFFLRSFATLLYRFLNCVKDGSAKEVALACRAIGELDYIHYLYVHV